MAGPVGMKVVLDTRGFQGIVSEAKSRNMTLKGVRAGIKVLVGPAKAGAPRRSGALRTAQGTKAAKGRKGRTIAYAVQGARTKYQKTYKRRVVKPGKYDHLVQGGTRPHRLGAGERLPRLAIAKFKIPARPGTSQTRGGMHPGARPNPYRKRAFRAHWQAIVAAVSKAMTDELKRLMAQAAKK